MNERQIACMRTPFPPHILGGRGVADLSEVAVVKFIQDSLTQFRRAICAGGVAGTMVPEDDLQNRAAFSERLVCWHEHWILF